MQCHIVTSLSDNSEKMNMQKTQDESKWFKADLTLFPLLIP